MAAGQATEGGDMRPRPVPGTPSPHLCDQVGLFGSFRYKAMPRS